MTTQLLYTIDQTAAVLGLGKTKTRELIATGRLESVTVGKARRVPVDALTAFVDRLRQEAEL